MRETNDRLVKIATGYGLSETAVTISFLQAYGISASAVPLQFASIYWHYVTALGGIGVHVPERQLKDAQILLDSVELDCESTKSSHAWHKVMIVIVFFFFSVPPPARGLFRTSVEAR